MTPEPTLLERIDAYIEGLFIVDDPALTQNLADARAAGVPEINVSANQGKLLYLLARVAGAARILEIGTLGGYSTTWLAHAMPPRGVLITLESIILPIVRRTIDGMSVSVVR